MAWTPRPSPAPGSTAANLEPGSPSNGAVAPPAEAVPAAFDDGDADLVEINPLILSTDGRVYALDAKVSSGRQRRAASHPGMGRLPGRQLSAAGDEREKLAKEKGLAVHRSGAARSALSPTAPGLAMSTLDTVTAGGRQRRELPGHRRRRECRGRDQRADGHQHRSRRSRSILINIFGGITRGDEVARGIVAALIQAVELRAPLVIRIDGTNAVEGRQPFSNSMNRDAGCKSAKRPCSPQHAVRSQLAEGR
ncbi:MAG: hypothetical protein V9E89_03585 [Ilumatobacteraceae bacterium]